MALTGYGVQAWGADVSSGGGGGESEPPVIAMVTPDGSTIDATEAVGITITDNVGVTSLFVVVKFSEFGVWELVHNGTNFAPRFAGASSFGGTIDNLSISIVCPDGWPAPPTFQIYAADASGNLAELTASYLLTAEEEPDLPATPPDLALLQTEGLRTAIVISLWTDRRVDADVEIPAGDGDRRGWWADEFASVDGDKIGSKLWLLDRSTLSLGVAQRAEQYITEALAWMIEDRVASAVKVSVTTVNPDRIEFEIIVTRPSGDNADFKFAHVWDAERAAQFDVSIFEAAA